MTLINRTRFWIAALSSSAVLVACGGHQPAAVSSPSPPIYNFAGISTHLHAETVQGIRATITWSLAPMTLTGSAQSTWVGIFGEADSTTRLSVKIAQIGWKERPPDPPRVFWEWGTDGDHVSTFYGPLVQPNEPLDVELDRSVAGAFTFYANGELVGTKMLQWPPSFVAATAETHDPSDVMAGSEGTPELLSGLEWKLNGQWQAIAVSPFSTYAQYRVTADSPGLLRIWDIRQQDA